MGFSVSDEVDLMLSLLLLQSVFGSTVVTYAAASQNNDEGQDQPKPPHFIVIAAALRLSTAVT